MRPFDWITFDCYGTLIDWESGIAEAFDRAAARDGVRIPPDQAVAAYSACEKVVEQWPGYRSYREVLREGAVRAAHMLGWRLSDFRGGFLADSLPSWRPFPDTNLALERLRAAGYRLGILSNVDDDLLEATRKQLSVPFDLIVTAQQVGAYKPSPRHFLAARESIGSARWLHAAQSNYHDIVPANALSIPTAWINRHSRSPLTGGTPTMECSDLGALAAAVT